MNELPTSLVQFNVTSEPRVTAVFCGARISAGSTTTYTISHTPAAHDHIHLYPCLYPTLNCNNLDLLLFFKPEVKKITDGFSEEKYENNEENGEKTTPADRQLKICRAATVQHSVKMLHDT